MGRYLRKFQEAFLKGDLILLLICAVINIFGILVIAVPRTTWAIPVLLSFRALRHCWAFSCSC